MQVCNSFLKSFLNITPVLYKIHVLLTKKEEVLQKWHVAINCNIWWDVLARKVKPRGARRFPERFNFWPNTQAGISSSPVLSVPQTHHPQVEAINNPSTHRQQRVCPRGKERKNSSAVSSRYCSNKSEHASWHVGCLEKKKPSLGNNRKVFYSEKQQLVSWALKSRDDVIVKKPPDSFCGSKLQIQHIFLQKNNKYS